MTQHHRAIFISDIHLGTKGCNATSILKFLREHESDILYLVGDIIDGWQLKRKWYWPQEHSDIIQKILRKARKGTKVIFIPGNHDEFARSYVNHSFGGIEILEETIHTMVDGRKMLVLHGDRFDEIIKNYKWLSMLGDVLYNIMLTTHNFNSWIRRITGQNHWSLSHFLKHQVKKTVNYISNYEEALIWECKTRNFDVVLCGHIHYPTIINMNGYIYLNDGDGVESCTAIVEEFDGTIKLLQYYDDVDKILYELKENTIIDHT
jgi:UDP-2,3-diacylglucosamine pyrophosphatase LpxH